MGGGGPLVQRGGNALVPTSPDQRCLCSHFPSNLGPSPRGISQHLKLPQRPALGQPFPQRYPCVHTCKHFTADCRQPEWSAWKILYWGFGNLISTIGIYAKLLQLCLPLCYPMDCSLPSSSVHGILQARMLEWVAMPSSRGSSWPRAWTQLSLIAGRFFTAEPPGKSIVGITPNF